LRLRLVYERVQELSRFLIPDSQLTATIKKVCLSILAAAHRPFGEGLLCIVLGVLGASPVNSGKK